jgi:hypothetical protein
MEMTSMQMSAEEAKEYGGLVSADAGNAPKYPYGLCLCLNDGSLQKLGITDLPPVGSELMVMAKTVVTSVRSSQQMDGDKESGVDLQITDMALSAPVKQIDPSVMYDAPKE